jgi:hypothetical protein
VCVSIVNIYASVAAAVTITEVARVGLTTTVFDPDKTATGVQRLRSSRNCQRHRLKTLPLLKTQKAHAPAYRRAEARKSMVKRPRHFALKRGARTLPHRQSTLPRK